MTTIGSAVQARSVEAIREAASEARQRLRLAPDGRITLTDDFIETLLCRHIEPAYGVSIDWRDDQDEELRGALGMYRPEQRVLLLRESVVRQASAGDVDAHFTIFHELGHIHMHSEAQHFRMVPGRALTKHHDAEWQADQFAIAFAIDRLQLIESYGPDNIRRAANYFRVPFLKLQAAVIDMKTRGEFASNKNGIEQYLDAIQGDFDF